MDKNNMLSVVSEEILNVLGELNENNTWINGSRLKSINKDSSDTCINFQGFSGQTVQYDISEISYIFKDEIILSDVENKNTIEKKLFELEMKVNQI